MGSKPSSGDGAGTSLDIKDGGKSEPVKKILAVSGGVDTSSFEAKIDALTVKFEVKSLTFKELLQNKAKECKNVESVIVAISSKDQTLECIEAIRSASEDTFIVAIHQDATEDAYFRQECWEYGVNMVTFDPASLASAMKLVLTRGSEGLGKLECPYSWCNVGKFTEDEMWHHLQLYHCNHPNNRLHKCPICCRPMAPNLQVHYRNNHGLVAKGIIPKEEVTGVFALVICRRPSDGKFLMTQEFAQTGFWVPGGQLDHGESLREGALRECQEEAGVDVEIKGILEILAKRKRWRRVIFYAEPKNKKATPKTIPDYESTGAVWVSIEELQDQKRPLKLRSPSEPGTWFPYLASGKSASPLQIPNEYAETFSDVIL